MKVSIIKIIKSDYMAVISLIAPMVMLLLYLDAKYIGLSAYIFSGKLHGQAVDPQLMLIIAIVTSVIFLPLLLIRVLRIRMIFKKGIEVEGIIRTVDLWKDRGRIGFVYSFEGKGYTKEISVHQSKFVKSLKPEQRISVIVMKDDRRKALIKEMFITDK
ncbi:MAG: hypothetical protein ABH846_01475 [Patescibacteria group bacterium]